MSRRALTALPLASALLTLLTVDAAHACDRTSWIYDPVDVTSCVDVSYVTVGQFEFANHCADALTLSAPDCEDCTVPGTIAPGQSGTLVLDPEPTREADGIVDLEWQTGDTSGTLTFTFPVNACEGWSNSSCVVASRNAEGWSWAPLAAGLVLLAVRRRSRTRK